MENRPAKDTNRQSCKRHGPRRPSPCETGPDQSSYPISEEWDVPLHPPVVPVETRESPQTACRYRRLTIAFPFLATTSYSITALWEREPGHRNDGEPSTLPLEFFSIRSRFAMTTRWIMRTLVICLIFSGSTLAQQRKVYKPTWKSLDQHTTSGWFRDAKLGLFIYGPGCTKEEWERYNARYGGRRGVARHLGAK